MTENFLRYHLFGPQRENDLTRQIHEFHFLTTSKKSESEVNLSIFSQAITRKWIKVMFKNWTILYEYDIYI